MIVKQTEGGLDGNVWSFFIQKCLFSCSLPSRQIDLLEVLKLAFCHSKFKLLFKGDFVNFSLNIFN